MMMTHKYHKQESDAQRKIKEAGFPVTLVQAGVRTGGPDYSPTFSDDVRTTLYVLDVSDDQKFRRDSATANFENILMVSTENVTADNKPAVGDGVVIAPTDDFPKLSRQSFQIMEVEALAPAGVPIFYTLMLSGKSNA